MKKILYFSIIAVAATFFFHNCASVTELLEDNNPGNDLNQNSGTLRFVMTSGSSSGSSSLAGIATNSKEDILSLIVTIEDLQVHRTSDSDAGWISLPIEKGEYDLILMDIKAWSELLSNTDVAPGTYNKFRFEVTGALVTTESGTYDVEIPSGVIKIGIPFIVNDDGTTEITLEIDPHASLKVKDDKKKDPTYKLSPVFHVTSVDEDGDDD